VHQFTVATGVNFGCCARHAGMEAVVEADLDDPGRSRRCLTELFHLLNPESRRLFDEHVSARVEGLDGKRGKLIVRRCDDHDLRLQLEQVA